MMLAGAGGGSTPDGSSSSNPGTSAKQIYDDGYVTSGKMIRWIDFGGSVGVKQVWCDFDTNDADGKSGWMLTAKFTEAKRWGGNGVTINTTTSYIDPNDGYAVSANMADALMNMFRVTVSDSANESLGSSAMADWYYEWNLDTIPWKVVWAPEQWQNPNQMLPTNGDKNYASRASGSGPSRTAIRKFQRSYNIKHSYIPVGHTDQNLTDFMNNQNASEVSANGGTGAGNNWGGDYSYKLIGTGTESNAVGTFNKWFALSTNGQKFEFYDEGRNANYANGTGGDTDGTLGILCNNTSKTHTGQDQDNENNVKIGYDDNTGWAHIHDGSGDTGNTLGNRNTRAENYNMYWWIK